MEERLSDIQLERLSVSSTLSKAIGLVKEKLAKVPNLKLLLDNLKNLGLEVESMLNMKGLYKTMLEESAEKGGLMKNMGRFLFGLQFRLLVQPGAYGKVVSMPLKLIQK